MACILRGPAGPEAPVTLSAPAFAPATGHDMVFQTVQLIGREHFVDHSSDPRNYPYSGLFQFIYGASADGTAY